MTNDATRTRPARAPRKAAPRKAAAPARARTTTGKAVTEPLAAQPQIEVTAPATGDAITFMGRLMLVKMPNPEQIALWPRLAARINERRGDLDETPRDGETVKAAEARVQEAASKLIGRMLTLITSVLVDQDDKDWVEDQIIDGTLRLATPDGQPSAADIVSLTVDHFRTVRPAAGGTGPQPKARRRA